MLFWDNSKIHHQTYIWRILMHQKQNITTVDYNKMNEKPVQPQNQLKQRLHWTILDAFNMVNSNNVNHHDQKQLNKLV